MPEQPDDINLEGDNPLSEREMEVAHLLVTGASNAEIARDLIISPHTVKVHLRNIFEKLRVNSRTEASIVLLQRGWIVVPGVEIPPLEQRLPEPPEPEPLRDAPQRMETWQRVLLPAALLVCLALTALPSLLVLAQAPANLLSDAGRPPAAPPVIRLEPRWEMRTPLQQPLSRAAMVVDGNHLYLMGGEQADGTATAGAQAYDLQTNVWLPIASMPAPRANLAATVSGGKIYVAGGSSTVEGKSTPTDSFIVYDPGADKWSSLAPLPAPLAGSALVASSDMLYLIGGWDGKEMRDEVWRIPIAEAGQPKWQVAGHLAKARAFLGAAPVGSEIYIVGGYDGQRELDLAEVFTPASGERRLLPSLGTPRGGLVLVYDGMALYALGGGWTRPITTHERYDVASGAWSNFPSPIQGAWRNLTAAAKDGRLDLVGGWSGSPIESHLQYQSSFRALLPVISNK